MSKRFNNDNVTVGSNDAIRGKPSLDIDRVFNVKETKKHEGKRRNN
ncbi:hypothetical protein [Aquibacillus sediminis]|nr:hypothetical protein [Aquibacillus sediminis]